MKYVVFFVLAMQFVIAQAQIKPGGISAKQASGLLSGEARPAIPFMATSHKKIVENAFYFLRISSSGKLLEVEDALFAKGRKIQQWEADNGTALKDKFNQQWVFFQVGYDNEKGAIFEIINTGFLTPLAHGSSNEVFAVNEAEYRLSINYKWYIRTVDNKSNGVEILSYANNKRLRLAESSADNGISFLLDASTVANDEALFSIEHSSNEYLPGRFTSDFVKIRCNENGYFMGAISGNPAIINCTAEQAQPFVISQENNSYYYTIKHVGSNQFLNYNPTTHALGFSATKNNLSLFNIMRQPRNTNKYFILPAYDGYPLAPGAYPLPGGGALGIRTGFIISGNYVSWQIN